MTYIPIDQEPDVIQDMIDAAWDQYYELIQKLANQEFRLHILPWLHKNHYYFLAGNGTWYVFKEVPGEKEESIFEDKIPKEILDILQQEVEGMPSNSLGSLMPDYPEGTDQ